MVNLVGLNGAQTHVDNVTLMTRRMRFGSQLWLMIRRRLRLTLTSMAPIRVECER